MKNKTIQRIKKSRLGRLLCRIVGEDTGAVMMEYVLVAMLIAAATVAAVAYFGRDTQGMFGVLGQAIYGKSKEANAMRANAATQSASDNASAQTQGAAFSSLDAEDGSTGNKRSAPAGN